MVANEVKELAKETAKATEDISRKIEAIQTDTTGAVTAIEQIGSVIGQINDIQNTVASAVEDPQPASRTRRRFHPIRKIGRTSATATASQRSP